MIPELKNIKIKEKSFLFPQDSISVEGESRYADVLKDRLRKLVNYQNFDFSEDSEYKLSLILDTVMKEEQYEIKIQEDQTVIKAKTGMGFAHGLTTLYWMIRENEGILKESEVQDEPEYEYRGFHLDSSRHFFEVETVKSMIEQATLRKINRMHWHLSDDQGYRIESKRYPKLNEVSAKRQEYDGSIYTGTYTFEDINEIVEYAKIRGMEIIPEIDMPGHVTAILAAYPELSCCGEPTETANLPGIMERILCVGRDEVIEFAKNLLDEVVPLFPYHQFHIGGDEVPKAEWKKCPHCQKRILENKLRDEEALQGYFTKEMAAHLKKYGKDVICWNESLMTGDLDENVIIQYWDEVDEDPKGGSYCANAFAQNRKCIYSYVPWLYFDYEPALTPMKLVYDMEPVLRNGQNIPKENVLGFECTLWSEYLDSKKRLEEMAFPRMFALAERGWNRKKEYEEYKDRCAKELLYLKQDGIYFYSMEEADPVGEIKKQQIIACWKKKMDLLSKYENVDSLLSIIEGMLRGRIKNMYSKEEIEEIVTEVKRDI